MQDVVCLQLLSIKLVPKMIEGAVTHFLSVWQLAIPSPLAMSPHEHRTVHPFMESSDWIKWAGIPEQHDYRAV